MGDRQILAHSIKRGLTSFHNAALKAFKKISYLLQRLQSLIFQNDQEVEYTNLDYRQKYCKTMKRSWCFFKNHSLRNMNQLRMMQVRLSKITPSNGRTETVVCNRCSYQVPAMVGTNTSTNEKHKFYNSTMQSISIVG